MEKEGLIRSLRLVENRGRTVNCMVTDRHRQISKYLREREEGQITQFYDVWHVEKSETFFSNFVTSYLNFMFYSLMYAYCTLQV